MSFIDQIEKIQKKPDHVRRKITTVTTVLSTGIIVIVWLTVANPLSLGSDQKPSGSENDPFSMLKDIKDTASVAGSAINDFKDGINEAKDYAEMLKQEVEKQNQDSIMTKEDLEAFLSGTGTSTVATSTESLDLNN